MLAIIMNTLSAAIFMIRTFAPPFPNSSCNGGSKRSGQSLVVRSRLLVRLLNAILNLEMKFLGSITCECFLQTGKAPQRCSTLHLSVLWMRFRAIRFYVAISVEHDNEPTLWPLIGMTA
jgi:hypothetical protein